ncbi:unnamed protein product [Leptidea sinapis]|uniref:Uncharacterized protein n=1 Tax=Leptidea sinapis TaxID=189913 RepID=A0A5E4PNY6_9NEOP|nr:unnamed protein product [Leptidea sinapis]
MQAAGLFTILSEAFYIGYDEASKEEKSSLCVPTLIRVKLGARRIALTSRGRCVCGHSDMNAVSPGLLQSALDALPFFEHDFDSEEQRIYLAVYSDSLQDPCAAFCFLPIEFSHNSIINVNLKLNFIKYNRRGGDELDMFWTSMAPVLYAEYNHDRTPSNALENPYDNPPEDFQYSDWVEDNTVKVIIAPMTFTLSTGLLHRLNAIKKILNEVMPAPTEGKNADKIFQCGFLQWKNATPCQRIYHNVVFLLKLPMFVLDSYRGTIASTRNQPSPVLCWLWNFLRASLIWLALFTHIGTFSSLQAKISAPDEDRHKPFARADLKFVVHSLLHKDYFKRHDNVNLSYSLKIIDVTLEYFSVRGYLTKNINTHIMSLHSAKATVLQATRFNMN